MATATYTFNGKAAWITRDPKFTPPVWTMNFYPQDAETRKAVKATGIKNKMQEDTGEKSGMEGFYYVFRSREPYAITDAEGKPIEAMVGNGSDVTVELEVETFTSKVHGEQARSKLVRVLVNNLIVYDPPAKEDKADLPA